MVNYVEEHGVSEPQPFRLRQRRRLFATGGFSGRLSLRRLVLAAVTFVLTIAFFVAIAGGLFFFRLSQGPIPLSLQAQVAKALSSRVKHGFTFEVGGTSVESFNGRPTLIVSQLQVKDESGRSVIKAPQAAISVDALKLVSGAIEPTRLDMHDVTLKLSILPDGSVAFSAGSDVTLPFRLSEAFDAAAPGPASASVPATGTPSGVAAGPTRIGEDDALSRLASVLAPLVDKFTGADDALGAFDRLGIARGTLVLDDRAHNSVRTYRNLDFDFDRVAEGASRVTLAADGAAGRWSATLHGTRYADARRTAELDIANVTLDDLGVFPALRDPGFDSDVPVNASLNLGLDAGGRLTAGRGDLSIGSGFFKLRDPDHEPVGIDRVKASFRFDAEAKHIVVEPSEIVTDTSRYDFGGTISPPRVADGDWIVAAGGKGLFGAERPNEKPIALDRIRLNASLNPSAHHFTIQELSIAGPQADLRLGADISSGQTGLKVQLTASAGRMPAPVILRLWPDLISAQVRAWLIANLQSGTVERGRATATLDENDLDKIRAQHSVADGHLQLDYTVSDVTLAFMAGVPPLRGVNGVGTVTGDTSKFVVNHGWMEVSPGRQLALPDGSLVVPSTDPKPTPAVIAAHVVGPVDVLSELLATDAFRGYAALPDQAASAKGQIDGVLTVGVNLGAKSRPEDIKVAANAKLSGLTIDKLVGKQSLTNGSIALALDKTGLTAKGDASIFGAPTTIDIRKPAGTGPGEANIQLTLDDAARVKAGFDVGRALTGPVVAKINKVLADGTSKAVIDIDLSRSAINGLVPGLVKPAGKPGRVTLTASSRDDGVDLDNIVCDIGTFSARGSANLDSTGGFQNARMVQVRLSPGDDVKVDASKAGEAVKLVVRGANLDARPFLKTLSSSDTGDGNGKDIDVDLHSNVLTGQNSQVLTGVDLRLVRKSGQIKKLQMTGKFGRSPVSITSTPAGNVLSLNATSSDAGAALAFLDLYKRVSGGRLETTIRMMDGRMDGAATIHDFGLREDPAMKRLTEETISQGKNGNVHIDASNLPFQKLAMTFSKTGSRVEVQDGALFSPQMGATVQGSIDFARDKLALSGTFVPIYGVNNLFAQLPLVGPILGGGAHEGLFGLNYKITGSVGTPTLSVDPLSALAPGFLRKIFGAISQAAEDNGAPAPRSTAPTVDPQAR